MREETKVAHPGKGHQGSRGQGQGQGHGNHDHERRKERLPQQQQRQKRTKAKRTSVARQETPQQESPPSSQPQTNAVPNGGASPTQTEAAEQEAETPVRQEAEVNGEENGGRSEDVHDGAAEEVGAKEEEERKAQGSPHGREGKAVSPVPSSPQPPKRLSREDYDVRVFNTSLDEFVDVLSDPRYQEMQGEYPVEDLMSVVSMVSACIEEYKEHTQHTNQQLQTLRDAMRNVKENLHLSITRQAFDLAAEERQTVEELELEAQLAQLNATVAQAHAEVAEANKLSAETSQRALQASVAAQQARHEAQRIEEEVQLKAERERKKREEEDRRREEEERRQAEEERRREEERREEERKRKKLEEEHSSWKKQEEMTLVDQWPPHIYSLDNGTEGGDLLCVIRAHPAHFNQNDVRCDVIAQQEENVTYGEQEELISRILDMKRTDDSQQDPVEAVYVAIPYTARLPASREAVVKAMVQGRWTELATQEAVLDGHKEYKFAQAKVESFTQLLVMSRFKRDYLCVHHPRRLTKLTSSYDHRVVLTVPKNTFSEKVQLVMQVQPVDSVNVSEFRSHGPQGKQLLTSSPILHLEWYASKLDKFDNNINITLPCPPNPAKARKLALLKKQKEEKLKAGNKPAFNLDDLINPTKKGPTPRQTPQPSQPQAVRSAGGVATADPSEEEEPPPRQNKWYMGQYGQTEDDENDQLCLMTFRGGRWNHETHVSIVQAKLDLLAFDIDMAYERLMVLRTRTDVEEDSLKQLAQGLTEQLSRRTVKVLLRRRFDNPYDICCNVVPTSAQERADRAMRAEGYTEEANHDGKDHVASLREGDTLQLQVLGNLRFQNGDDDDDDDLIQLPYNSNLPTHASFQLAEVNKYLQKNFDVYRGKVRVIRKYEIFRNPKLRRAGDDECVNPIYNTDVIFEVDVDIPKYHVEPDPSPVRVAVVMPERGVLGEGTLRQLAQDLGNEWSRLAYRLNVRHERQEAIRRSVVANAGREEEMKYTMLVTWLKRCPQADDKVSMLSSALESVGRRDLAKQLRLKERERTKTKARKHSRSQT